MKEFYFGEKAIQELTRFYQQAGGTSTPPFGKYDLLIVEEDGKYEVLHGSAEMWDFNGNLLTTPLFWDCECSSRYLHPITENHCDNCDALRENQPDSRLGEVLNHIQEWELDAGLVSWLKEGIKENPSVLLALLESEAVILAEGVEAEIFYDSAEFETDYPDDKYTKTIRRVKKAVVSIKELLDLRQPPTWK